MFLSSQVGLILLGLGLVPLTLGWRANCHMTLVHALSWGLIAWLSWGVTVVQGPWVGGDFDVPSYLALCLTGCAGMAVMGARRPHAGLWNFVVLGLLTVLVLPLAETLLVGQRPLGIMRLVFLGAILVVGVINYLPTRAGWAALLLGIGGLGELLALAGLAGSWGRWCVLASLWIGWWSWLGTDRPVSAFNRLWLDFRDRYGLFWAQRMREYFNQAASNAGWPVRLYWQGLLLPKGATPPEPAVLEAMVTTLRSLLQRFG